MIDNIHLIRSRTSLLDDTKIKQRM